jgi:endonuclease/exonuclease/phosphatase (EEP) superfamily protein YafD
MRVYVLASAVASGPGCAAVQNYLDVSGPRYASDAAPEPNLARLVPAEAAQGLRIVTFNIKFARQIERAIDLLRAEDPLREADVIALQEMDAPGVERIARALGMAYVYYPAAVHPRGGKDFGNAVLVRGLIEEDHKLILPHAGRFGGMRRIAVSVTARVEGRRLRVYSTHLGTPKEVSPAARQAQVAAILEDARGAEAPVVVAGRLQCPRRRRRGLPGGGLPLAHRGRGPHHQPVLVGPRVRPGSRRRTSAAQRRRRQPRRQRSPRRLGRVPARSRGGAGRVAPDACEPRSIPAGRTASRSLTPAAKRGVPHPRRMGRAKRSAFVLILGACSRPHVGGARG